ncbi:MAG: right-handed parallel beta-helix repeat-containing protein, partial [Thermoplasmata archaeon]|nr:right-handed parallel beta-helix repeat-containing protein [Thermoplasmata archaeon]
RNYYTPYNIHYMDVKKNGGKMNKIFVAGMTCILLTITILPATPYQAGMTNNFHIEKRYILTNGGGNILYVGGSGPNNYTKIQDAIDDASDGDKIVVYPKVYKENVVINKSLTLIGLNFPIIDACGKGDAMNITANNCYIKGFNITGVKENATNHAGIKICSSENVIMNNIIWKCESNGIYLKNSERNNISNNVIVYTRWYSIYLRNSSNNTFFNNTISSKISGDGITMYSSSNNLFIKNWIYKNNVGISTSFGKGSYYNNFTGNLVEDNIFGMFLDSKNTIIKNIFTNNYGGGLRISGGNNVIKNNKFKNCGIMIWNGVNVIENNTANGKPIYSYMNEKKKQFQRMLPRLY